MSTVSVGNNGEELACNFLRKLGFKIVERNYRIRGGELDIIAREGEWLVFIEVKARYSYKYGLPVESITPWKLRALLKSALFYIQKINWGDGPYRVDVVSVDFVEDRSNPKIELIKNVTG